MKQPTIVACGVGRDSTAMLVRMHRLGWRPDAILFANVGSEREATILNATAPGAEGSYAKGD